jgi:hypothetical protein
LLAWRKPVPNGKYAALEIWRQMRLAEVYYIETENAGQQRDIGGQGHPTSSTLGRKEW